MPDWYEQQPAPPARGRGAAGRPRPGDTHWDDDLSDPSELSGWRERQAQARAERGASPPRPRPDLPAGPPPRTPRGRRPEDEDPSRRPGGFDAGRTGRTSALDMDGPPGSFGGLDRRAPGRGSGRDPGLAGRSGRDGGVPGRSGLDGGLPGRSRGPAGAPVPTGRHGPGPDPEPWARPPGRDDFGRDDLGRDDIGRDDFGRDDFGVPPRGPAGRGAPPGVAGGGPATGAVGYGGSLGPLAPGGPGAQVLDRRWAAPTAPLPGDEDELESEAGADEPRPTGRRGRRGRPATPEPGAEPGPRPELPYVGGFDGLRAVALLGVLAFHQGFELARGGFLGISSFFTLSGFLLTTLALAEWSGNGRLALGRLWEGRARRLVPAFLFTVALVVVLQVVLRVGAGPGFRGDVLAAVGQFLNWRFVLEGDGFDSVLVNPSPVQHLWGMSVLVQLTVVFPVLFVGLMKLTGKRWRVAGATVALAAAGSFAAAWFAAESSGNDGIAYYGTHTRAGELLVGAVLAFVVLSSRARRAIGTPGGVKAVRFGAPLALLALAVLWSTASLYSRNLFGGVTAVNALLTAWLVFAVTLPGPASTVLGSLPLRTLGKISYAAFLVHWPLYLLLDPDRTGIDGIALFGVRLAATLALGAALTFGLERPFRRAVRLPRPRLALALGACAALVAVAALVLPEQPPRGVSLSVDDGSGAGDLDVVAPSGSSAASVALVGGSLAGDLTPGFGAWNVEHPDQQVTVHTHISRGCPLSGPGPVRVAGEVMGDDLECVGFGPRLPELLSAAKPDVVVVVPGVGDLGEREIDREWLHLGDPVYDTWLVDRLDSLADTLAREGVPVLWATSPHVRLAPGPGMDGYWSDVPDNDPTRVDRLNEIIRHVVAGREDFTVVDLQDWAQRLPQGEFGVSNRAEGVGLTELGATRAASWLTPQVLEALGIAPTPPAEGGETAPAPGD